jgi:uncharacterized radical SAM superfamily protein
MAELTVGQKRTFTGDKRQYIIEEIIENPSISLEWTWFDTVCPHCRGRLQRTITHTFHRIEILKDETKDKPVSTDLAIMGDTHDGKRMLFPIDKYKDILKLSEKFKTIEEEPKDVV